jgi:galactokinase/mevalonate kinase-like predicted kinase
VVLAVLPAAQAQPEAGAAAGAPNDPADLVRVCARLAEDKKAEQIVILDLRGLMYVTDFFLIASGANARQLQAIRIAIHEDMAKHYREGKGDYLDGMNNLKRIAREMRRGLLRGDFERFGELLHEGWIEKRRLSGKITSPEIDRLYEIARGKGAIGGKILGAGGGGHLLVFCKPDKKFEVEEELIKYGVKTVSFGFEPEGLQTWRVKE